MNRPSGSPAIGWFMLSEANRAAAARYLSKLQSDGTRDELGFAPIHFAFADRFFPGTSVQHAQLRYVLFVAWTYEELRRESAGLAFPDGRLGDIEARFSARLIRHAPQLANSGISGWTRYQNDRRPVVRVSRIYWSALKAWGLLEPWGPAGQPPNQNDVHGRWPRLAVYDEGGDGARAKEAALFDPGLPKAPANWTSKSAELTFDLGLAERAYFKQRWRQAGGSGVPPLLSRLADSGTAPDIMWDPKVAALASPAEKRALILAEQAAALCCIARAVHSVLIEARRNEDLNRNDDRHAAALAGFLKTYRDDALALDVAGLRRETGFDDRLEAFLVLMQAWIRKKLPARELLEPMSSREHHLKGPRAYLSNKARREDWRKGLAQPLDYRWPAVRNLIESVI